MKANGLAAAKRSLTIAQQTEPLATLPPRQGAWREPKTNRPACEDLLRARGTRDRSARLPPPHCQRAPLARLLGAGESVRSRLAESSGEWGRRQRFRRDNSKGLPCAYVREAVLTRRMIELVSQRVKQILSASLALVLAPLGQHFVAVVPSPGRPGDAGAVIRHLPPRCLGVDDLLSQFRHDLDPPSQLLKLP